MQRLVLSAFVIFTAVACRPRVEIAAPEEPITINLNVKIEHDVRVKIDKQLEEQVFSEKGKLF